MNREIKFRVWNTHYKEMYDFDPYGCAHILSGDAPHGILLQYTGIKDKNGKEIYEGDILKSYKHRQFSIGVVEWDTYAWALLVKTPKGERGYDLSTILEELIDSDNPKSSTHEVIGNKFENPELLKESNQ